VTSALGTADVFPRPQGSPAVVAKGMNYIALSHIPARASMVAYAHVRDPSGTPLDRRWHEALGLQSLRRVPPG
jgi:hypothetical protein